MNFTGDCPIILMSDTDDRNGRKSLEVINMKQEKLLISKVMVMVLIIKGKILFL